MQEERVGAVRDQAIVEALITRTHALGERVKELNGLYAVSKLVSDPEVSLHAIFEQSVRLIPPAWQYPASTCARIVFLGEAFATDNFRETPWRQAVDLVVAGQAAGMIEVFYLEPHVGPGEEPFLQEERHLLEALGRELGNAVERKQAQETRREAEKQTRYQATLLQNVSEAIIGLDTDFATIRSWNKAAEKIYEWTADEVVGRSVIDVLRPDPLVPEEAGSHFLASGHWTGEVVQQRKNGTRLVVAASASVVKDLTGNVIGAVYVNRDVTRQKEAEAALKAMEREVLEISHREQRRIGRDLHDGLGAHLTGIAMVCRTLARRAEKGKPVGAEELNHVADLVQEGITEARRLARGLNPVKLEKEGLRSALQELASLMQARSGVPCTFTGDEDGPDLDSETATQLYRIAQEAAYNALKHARPTTVAIRLERGDDRIVLSVRDDGVGLSPALPEAEGMGLRVMHYRARMIGGTFAVQSTPGRGTLITCTLPHADAAPEPAP